MRQCTWTVEAANHTKSTQLNLPITELITITIATTSCPRKKKLRIYKTKEFFTLHIVSARDVCPKCVLFVTVMVKVTGPCVIQFHL